MTDSTTTQTDDVITEETPITTAENLQTSTSETESEAPTTATEETTNIWTTVLTTLLEGIQSLAPTATNNSLTEEEPATNQYTTAQKTSLPITTEVGISTNNFPMTAMAGGQSTIKDLFTQRITTNENQTADLYTTNSPSLSTDNGVDLNINSESTSQISTNPLSGTSGFPGLSSTSTLTAVTLCCGFSCECQVYNQ